MVTAYYVVPVRADRELGWRLVLTAVALTMLGAIVTRYVRRDSDPIARLFIVLLGTIVTLSLAAYATAATPGQFTGLETRTDALYFTIVTMATIGYGDIHPTGQVARILVMVAILFPVIFLTALISTIARRLRLGEGGTHDRR